MMLTEWKDRLTKAAIVVGMTVMCAIGAVTLMCSLLGMRLHQLLYIFGFDGMGMF